MGDVAGGDREAMLPGDRGDLPVRHAEREAELLAQRHHLAVVSGGLLAEGQGAPGERRGDYPLEALLERLATQILGQGPEAVTNLAQGDGGQKERRGAPSVESG